MIIQLGLESDNCEAELDMNYVLRKLSMVPGIFPGNPQGRPRRIETLVRRDTERLLRPSPGTLDALDRRPGAPVQETNHRTLVTAH